MFLLCRRNGAAVHCESHRSVASSLAHGQGNATQLANMAIIVLCGRTYPECSGNPKCRMTSLSTFENHRTLVLKEMGLNWSSGTSLPSCQPASLTGPGWPVEQPKSMKSCAWATHTTGCEPSPIPSQNHCIRLRTTEHPYQRTA